MQQTKLEKTVAETMDDFGPFCVAGLCAAGPGDAGAVRAEVHAVVAGAGSPAATRASLRWSPCAERAARRAACRRRGAAGVRPAARGRPPWARAARRCCAWPALAALALGAGDAAAARRRRSTRPATIPESELRHLLLVLDVSPSMRLEDAGPDGKQSRVQAGRRPARVVLRARADRAVPHDASSPSTPGPSRSSSTRRTWKSSATSSTTCRCTTRSRPGRRTSSPAWRRRRRSPSRGGRGSTTLLVVSDGDTVPATGMPKMPASVAHVLVVGVGDPAAGKFIDGHQSRQDASTLRQVAVAAGRRRTTTATRSTCPPTSSARSRCVAAARRVGAADAARVRPPGLRHGARDPGAARRLALHLAGTRWRPGPPVANRLSLLAFCARRDASAKRERLKVS